MYGVGVFFWNVKQQPQFANQFYVNAATAALRVLMRSGVEAPPVPEGSLSTVSAAAAAEMVSAATLIPKEKVDIYTSVLTTLKNIIVLIPEDEAQGEVIRTLSSQPLSLPLAGPVGRGMDLIPVDDAKPPPTDLDIVAAVATSPMWPDDADPTLTLVP